MSGTADIEKYDKLGILCSNDYEFFDGVIPMPDFPDKTTSNARVEITMDSGAKRTLDFYYYRNQKSISVKFTNGGQIYVRVVGYPKLA